MEGAQWFLLTVMVLLKVCVECQGRDVRESLMDTD